MMGQFSEVQVILPIFKDVMRGFYVDIGAHNGVTDSNTLYFYQRGWRGICVEPHRHYFQQLRQNRIHDTCLNIAIWKEDRESIKFYATDPGGWSRLEAPLPYANHAPRSIYPVRAITLRRLLEENNVPAPFDLLSVDVEGHEREVLSTLDVEKYRPRAVIVEDLFRRGFDDVFRGYKAIRNWDRGVGGANIVYIRMD